MLKEAEETGQKGPKPCLDRRSHGNHPQTGDTHGTMSVMITSHTVRASHILGFLHRNPTKSPHATPIAAEKVQGRARITDSQLDPQCLPRPPRDTSLSRSAKPATKRQNCPPNRVTRMGPSVDHSLTSRVEFLWFLACFAECHGFAGVLPRGGVERGGGQWAARLGWCDGGIGRILFVSSWSPRIFPPPLLARLHPRTRFLPERQP